MNKGTNGIWTPWAAVLCGACHGNAFRGVHYSAQYMQEHYGAEREPGENEALTTCDKCGRPIVLDDSTANEHEMVKALQAVGITEAAMDQTGGMQSACSVEIPNGHRILVAYRFDGDKAWYVGGVDAEDNTIDGLEAHPDDAAAALAFILKVYADLKER